jgi:hypothetical protein
MIATNRSTSTVNTRTKAALSKSSALKKALKDKLNDLNFHTIKQSTAADDDQIDALLDTYASSDFDEVKGETFDANRVLLQLCNLDEIRSYSEVIASQPSDNDIRTRNKKLVEQLLVDGGRRTLKRIPANWQLEISYLRRTYPNASNFLDLLEDMCCLAHLGDGVLQMPPVVLDGPPGGGKSVMTEEIAATFSGGYVRIAMAGMELGSELGGSDPGWGQTRVGKVFSLLSSTEFANPIFLLDEIDKTAGSDRFSPWAPLYDLLEPSAARTFRDRSFDAIAINASRVTWIATSNDFSAVPAAIASRFTTTYMPLPSPDELQLVLHSVWERLQVANPVCAGFTLPDEMYIALQDCSPRTMGQMLLRACARAAREGTYVLHERHLPATPVKRQRQIGFYP